MSNLTENSEIELKKLIKELEKQSKIKEKQIDKLDWSISKSINKLETECQNQIELINQPLIDAEESLTDIENQLYNAREELDRLMNNSDFALKEIANAKAILKKYGMTAIKIK